MGQLFIYSALFSTAIVSLARPWIGVVVAYLFVVLTPQSIWWWNFDGLRPVLWVMIPTLIGFISALFRKRVTFESINNSRNLFFLILWAAYTLSYYAGPYVDYNGPLRITDPNWAFSTLNKMFLLYFLACFCIDDAKKLKVLAYILMGAGVYLIYWANNQYFSGLAFGRIRGPVPLGGGGIYQDENNFAMLFVVTLPFIWYMGFTVKSRIFRWILWGFIPFGWHAIFLTGSRGGLVGIVATMLVMGMRSGNRKVALLLLPAFVFAYVWQAGDVMRERAGSITEYQAESSAQGRIQAWGAAMNMMGDHPITGVGLASFVPAFPDYSEHQPREAHNTFFQIAGESGIVAGAMYLTILMSFFVSLVRNSWQLRIEKTNGSMVRSDLFYINEAVFVGFVGLAVCSVFLSLQLFEIFFTLGVLVNASTICVRKINSPSESESS